MQNQREKKGDEGEVSEEIEGVTINRTLSLIEKLKLLDFNTKTKGKKKIRMIKQEIVFYFEKE